MAAKSFQGELLAIIDPTNVASMNAAERLGFALWKQAVVDGDARNICRYQVG